MRYIGVLDLYKMLTMTEWKCYSYHDMHQDQNSRKRLFINSVFEKIYILTENLFANSQEYYVSGKGGLKYKCYELLFSLLLINYVGSVPLIS